jgi:glutamyl-Q tRNA(Asp) synthetase
LADEAFVTRFAPSPTGRLHLGHAFSALTAFDAARARGGVFLLRIEDIDLERRRDAFETAILEDLAWLGLSWPAPVRRQSEHFADYAQALSRLAAEGLLYRCFRTRKEVLDAMSQAPHERGEVFFGGALPPAEEERRLAAGEPFAWRLDARAALAALGSGPKAALKFVDGGPDPQRPRPVVQTADGARLGDVVLGRKGLGAAYHLAVVVDDALQGVTHVIRGEDLTEAVHVQRLLQALLGLPTPVYHHHPLIRDEHGRRLAKRAGAPSLESLRQEGLGAAEVRARLGLPPAV